MHTTSLLKKINRLLEKKANQILKAEGITHAYTYFLMELYRQDGQNQMELHKKIGIEQPTAVRTLDRMERDGLIARHLHLHDRRVFQIHLTEKSRQLQTKIEKTAQSLNEKALKNLTKQEQEHLHCFLEKIQHSLVE